MLDLWDLGQVTDSLLGQINDFKLYSKELLVPLEIPQGLCAG